MRFRNSWKCTALTTTGQLVQRRRGAIEAAKVQECAALKNSTCGKYLMSLVE